MSDSDQPILHAIENGSYKIAQTLLQKKLKKYPNKLYYYALNYYILFKQGKVTEAVQESLKLKAKTPSDPQTLKLLYEIFKSSNHKQDAAQVFENAIKKYANHDLIFTWFELALRDFDIRSIQKSCMSLQKYSKSRKYTLWAAFTYYLLSVQLDATEVEKTLYPKVALRLVESLKPYQNEQEVYIFVKILILMGEYQEAVTAIEEFSKGRKFDLELQINLLECLDKLENWDSLYKYSYQILFEDNMDDFDTWKYLIKASNGARKSDEVATQLQAVTSRNATLARIIFSKDVLESAVSFNEDLAAYYERFKYKLCCFNDIKYFYERDPTYFDRDSFTALINNTSSKIVNGGEFSERELNVLVNNQKLNKLLGNTDDFLNKNYQYYNLFQSVLQKKDEKDYFSGDEFLLMNVEIILETSSVTDEKFIQDAYKCVVLLENAAKLDGHEFRLRLWLMKLYSFINCHSLATANFDHLHIKMIQNDTLSHLITTRISSLNPNPLMLKQHLITIQKFYLTIEQEVEEMVSNGFESLTLNKIESFLEFGKRINQSVSKLLNLIEMLKMSKIVGNNQSMHYSIGALKADDPLLVTEFYDNRDFISEWKFGAQVTNDNVERAISIGPKQSSEYIKSYYLRELILQETHAEKAKALVTKLNKFLNDETTQRQLTGVESWSYKVYLTLFKLYVVNPNNDADFNFLIKNLTIKNIKNKVFKSELTSNLLCLSWEVNHKLITVFELVRNINLFTTMHHLPKEYSPKVAELKKANSNLLEELRDFKKLLDSNANTALKLVESQVKASINEMEGISAKVVDATFAKINTSLQESSLSRRIP